MTARAYLQCPECGEDAGPSDGVGLHRICVSDPGGDHAHENEPLWFETDIPIKCPGCGVALHVRVDEDSAYMVEAA